MKNLLLRLLVPAGIAGGLLAITTFINRMGFLPDAVAFWVWPCVIALVLLVFAVFALLRGARVWLIVFGVGFLVQVVGTLLLLGRVFESRWDPLWYTLGAIGLALLVVGTIWLVDTIRARRLERRMAEGLGGEGGNEQELARIRQDMQGALDLLRRAGRGRNAIYDLPWFLVMGRPAAGKTVAIKNSGLGLPVRKDWVKGVGGTYTCDWFFTNEMIFLDTPGKWVTEGTDADAKDYWMQLLRLLRKFRGRRPLDGLVVVVPADDLLSKDEVELEEQASHIREVVDLIHKELKFRFPVYLLVSKCDLVEGFVDFFRGLPAQRRHEILGWSNEQPNRKDAGPLIAKGFASVERRLEAYRLEMLGKVASRTRARRLFFFTEEFKELAEPLAVFADAFFQEDRFHETPVFRGFYFTSGTQEGSPLSRAMAQLARTLGVAASTQGEAAEDEPKRSYFLLDLFRELMVGDEGLIGRTAVHWWRQRRNTALVFFAPAGLALLVLVMSLVSLLLNRGQYREVRRETPRIVEQLEKFRPPLAGDDVLDALALTGELRADHRALAGFSLPRSFGMRRPGALAGRSFQIFKDGFTMAVLEPTLSAAEAVATDPATSCLGRIGVLHSVVWLRMGRRAQWSDDLGGFDRVWGLEGTKADEATSGLLRQYGYMKSQLGADQRDSLLPGFSIRRVAQVIRDQCGTAGATSTLEMYRRFQEDCRSPVTGAEIRECYTRLQEVLRNRQQDYGLFVARFRALKEDLERLKIEEPEASRGLELLSGIDLVEQQSSECLVNFENNIVPVIASYAARDDLRDACRQEVEAAGTRTEKFRVRNDVLKAQEDSLASAWEDVTGAMADYSTSCREAVPGFRRLEPEILRKVATSYRRVACFAEEQPPASHAPAPVRRAARRAASYTFFESPPGVSSAYSREHLDEQIGEWSAELGTAEAGFDDAQRAAAVSRVRGEVSSYAGSYASAWIRYLRGLELKSRRASVADWLQQLSTTAEYSTLIGRAAAAVNVTDKAAKEPFDVLADRLRPVAGLGAFLASRLSEYQALLGRIAQDLQRCNQDSGFFRQYKQQVTSDDANNALVQARSWVSRNAGATLADNSLRDLFATPLEAARQFVLSDNLLKSQWSDLVRLYGEDVRPYAPFSGDLEGSEPITVENLTALLGGATGAVTRVREAAGDGGLSPASEAWLERAEALSRALFERGTDRLLPVRARVTLGDPVLEPKDFNKKYEVQQLRMFLGEAADFACKQGDDRTKRLDLSLFGNDRSEYSYVRGSVAERKGLIGRTIGADFKEGEPYDAAVVEGFWAPLRVIQAGLTGAPNGEDLDLVYKMEVPWKKDKTGTITVPVRVTGEALPLLLELMRGGMPPPPENL